MLKIASCALLQASVRGDDGLSLLQHRAEKKHMHPEEDDSLCDPYHGLNLHHSKVLHSNLGGAGPDEGDETLEYGNVSVVNGKSVNMVVTAGDDYVAYNSEHNGLAAGGFGRVNVQVNTSATLNFQFVDGETGEEVQMPALYFTVFDLDQGMDHESREKFILRGLVEYKLVNDTELKVENLGADIGVSFSSKLQQQKRKVEDYKLVNDSTEAEVENLGADVGVSFSSSQRGGKTDNPVNPFDLTSKQQKRAVMAKFPKGNGFSITWTESHFAGLQGRNLLFAGASSLGCKREGSCSSFVCPDGFALRTMAEFLACDQNPCNDQDLHTCCFSA